MDAGQERQAQFNAPSLADVQAQVLGRSALAATP